MLHALLAVRSEDDFMASRSERVLKQRSHVRVVIYDKNPSHMSPSPEHGLYPKDFKLFLAEFSDVEPLAKLGFQTRLLIRNFPCSPAGNVMLFELSSPAESNCAWNQKCKPSGRW